MNERRKYAFIWVNRYRYWHPIQVEIQPACPLPDGLWVATRGASIVFGKEVDMICNCSCTHSGQDKIHGKGKRVFNPCKLKVAKDPGFRCTVCLREIPCPPVYLQEWKSCMGYLKTGVSSWTIKRTGRPGHARIHLSQTGIAPVIAVSLSVMRTAFCGAGFAERRCFHQNSQCRPSQWRCGRLGVCPTNLNFDNFRS